MLSVNLLLQSRRWLFRSCLDCDAKPPAIKLRPEAIDPTGAFFVVPIEPLGASAAKHPLLARRCPETISIATINSQSHRFLEQHAGGGVTNGGNAKMETTMVLSRLFGSALLAVGLLNGAAFAQGQGASGASGSQDQQAQALPEEIKQKLEKHGFTDVQVVPGSYIVTAKAKDGDPITAIIGPNSLTVFTMNAPTGGSTVGSGSKAGGKDRN